MHLHTVCLNIFFVKQSLLSTLRRRLFFSTRYKAKVDKEIKEMQHELEKLRRQAREMYSIEMKSCMDLVTVGVRL